MNSSTQKKKHGYRYRRSWYLRAIVIDPIDGRTFGRGPYHNIRNVGWAIEQFKGVMKNLFPNATHINFYNFKGEFQFQERYQVEQLPAIKNVKLQRAAYYDLLFPVTGESRYHNEVIFAQHDP